MSKLILILYKGLILKIFHILFPLISSFSAFAVEFSDISGTYSVTTDYAPIVNIIEISPDGRVELTEKSPFGELTCSGYAVIQQNVLVSNVVCLNGSTFTQTVDFSNVLNFDDFSAPVYSSLYGNELFMNFKRE